MGIASISIERPVSLLDQVLFGLRKALSAFATLAFTAVMLFMLFMAWANRSEAVWTAEEGWGYAFGILGGVMMLLLLIYPLRKRWRAISGWLSVKFWFRLHMIFGVMGPVLIMMHSSYRLGSMNGRVALFSMLLVAFSGLFGRYFYRRLHYGLYGKRATFASLRADSDAIDAKLGPQFKLKPSVQQMLMDYEQRALKVPGNLLTSVIHLFTMRFQAARLYHVAIHSLNRKLLAAGQHKMWSRSKVRREQQRMRHLLISHRRLLRQIHELHFFERLFSFWHLLHLPLFIMMIVTGFVHVYAVHAY